MWWEDLGLLTQRSSCGWPLLTMLRNHSSSLEVRTSPLSIGKQRPRSCVLRCKDLLTLPSEIWSDRRFRLCALPPAVGEKDSTGTPPQVPTLERCPPSGDQNQNYVQSQLELLEKLTSAKEGSEKKGTIAEQLAKKVPIDKKDEAVVPLVKRIPMEYDDLTISQKRNIRRQKYLDQVSKRNDAPLFTAIGLFVLLPPVIILGIAVVTGYIDLPS